MNIEECTEQLKDLRLHCLSIGYEFDKDAEAIEWILTAYEKEKEENVKLRLQDIPLIEGELKAYKDRVNELKQELEKEKGEKERIGKLYYEANENCIKYEKMIEKEKEKNKKAIDFINDENNYFEDGENWQNLLKIKQILEE